MKINVYSIIKALCCIVVSGIENISILDTVIGTISISCKIEICLFFGLLCLGHQKFHLGHQIHWPGGPGGQWKKILVSNAEQKKYI